MGESPQANFIFMSCLSPLEHRQTHANQTELNSSSCESLTISTSCDGNTIEKKHTDEARIEQEIALFEAPVRTLCSGAHANIDSSCSFSKAQESAHHLTYLEAAAKPKKRGRCNHESEDMLLSKRDRTCSTSPVRSRATMPKWSPDEDERLREAVSMYGNRNWTKI